VVFGCSILLTAAGQFRIRTGFPLTFPWERHQQTNHKVFPCQTKYCVFSWQLKLSTRRFRPLLNPPTF
jgi:hypothetical protein